MENYQSDANEMFAIVEYCLCFDYNDSLHKLHLIDCEQLNVCFCQDYLT